MQAGDNKVASTITRIAGVIAVVIAASMPTLYFVTSYRQEAAVLSAEAEINARIATEVVNSSPVMWRFQREQLDEFLRLHRWSGALETRRIIDNDGKTIAESAEKLLWPVLTRSAELFDAGVPVGRLEMSHSLSPIIVQTFLVTSFAALLGAASFVVIRVLPLRALNRAMAENVKLIKNLDERVAELTGAEARLKSLFEINLATTSTLELSEMLAILMEKIDQSLPFEKAVQIWLVNPETKVLERAACRNLDETEWKSRPSAGIPRLIQYAVDTKSPVTIANVQTDARIQNPEFYRRHGLVSHISVPLIDKGEVVGDLVLLTKMQREFPDVEIEFLRTLAAEAAIAIQNSLLYERIRRQAADLERSNMELQQFAYVASHDLQEPLRMITGYTNLLAKRYRGRLDASADEFIDFAVDGAKRMRVLINDLLTYSRVGSQGRKPVPTDCELVLSQTLAGLEFAIRESAARVTHDPLPTVNGDDVQLGQLFQNLIGNALKYRNGHEPTVHIGCERRENEWLMSVCDNGIGIDPRFAERIFVIFQRLHTREQYPGTGIGLAVCKRIVERHGGKIWVESEPERGSTFYFTLPAPESNLWAERAAMSPHGTS
jgi:signal transduction histidine kinase